MASVSESDSVCVVRVNGGKSMMGLLALGRSAFSDRISDSPSDCCGNGKVQRPGFVAVAFRQVLLNIYASKGFPARNQAQYAPVPRLSITHSPK